jgi:folate-binding protein YgfZ
MTGSEGYTRLENRGLIQLEGAERHAFLQNLISNDIQTLRPGRAVYACLLNAQGKFLHDFFISEGDGFTMVECEGGGRAQDLYKRLTMYRLRADVQISVEEAVPVYTIFGGKNVPGYPDPRHADMGWRSFEKPEGVPEKSFADWDRHRISLTIPDGSRDMLVENSTLLECNIDKLNGVSFDKGCYVGQEITARMHYRGLTKKHLYTVRGKNLPAPFAEIRVDGKLIGEMRSSCGDLGLALLKDEFAEKRDPQSSGFEIL